MGKHFALALQLPAYQSRSRKNKIRSSPILKNINYEHIGIAVFALLICTFLAYLIQVNNFAAKGYEINQLQNKISGLQADYKKLEAESSQLQSIQAIQSDNATFNMVPVNSVSYVQPLNLSQR
jgi:hypothetical protein